VYVPALIRHDSLAEAERTAIVTESPRLTGIEPRYVDQRTLTISKAECMDQLTAARGLELGRYGSRMTTPRLNRGTTRWSPLIDGCYVGRGYVGGHMVYADLEARRELQRECAVFVSERGSGNQMAESRE
jgi:hypothetical protein